MIRSKALIFSVLVGLLFLPQTLFSNESCRTQKCHAKMLKYKFMHDPFEECDTCHDVKDEKKHTFELNSEEQELCLGCHSDVLEDRPEQHAPVESCTGCHSPHGSEHPRLFTAARSGLCVECHDDMAPEFAKAKSVHLPAQWNCQSCHDAHGSKESTFLKKPITQLCESCHPKPRSAKHPKVVGGCIKCHEAHYAQRPNLLKAAPKKPASGSSR